jgi:uncharacterized protein involved in response to NO
VPGEHGAAAVNTVALPTSPTAWRASRLLSAPHRLGFAVGGALMSLLALWWLLVLAVGERLGLSWAVAPAQAHGLMFTLGFMPAFMAGFLFTAGPRWLGLPGVDARRLFVPLLQFGVGWLFVLIGVHVGGLLPALGLALAATGWLRLCLRFAALVRVSVVPDRLHARALLAASLFGVAAMLLACWALLQGDAALQSGATRLGLWGFVAPVFAIASHRMTPFFSAAALPLLVGLPLAGLAETGWLPPGLLAWPLGVIALTLLVLALRWRLAHGRSQRLLVMLHCGFVWLGLALGLQALKGAGLGTLGAAPLHALTLGCLGSTLIAMATRVSAGHSGRSLAVDRKAWALFGLLQLGVLMRLVAALGLNGALLPAAAIWALVTLAWSWRCGGWLGRPRVDGRPG